MKKLSIVLFILLSGCVNVKHSIEPKIIPKKEIIQCDNMDELTDVFLKSEVKLVYTCRF